MSFTALLIFMMLSQIAITGYLLYSFNDVEREAKKRNVALHAHLDAVLAALEGRGGSAPRPASAAAPSPEGVERNPAPVPVSAG